MKLIALLLLITLCSSCVSKKEPNTNKQETAIPERKEKSIKEYAKEYCNCMHESEELIDCEQLLIDFQTEFGSKNKEAEMEFSKEMQNCL